MLVRLLLLLAAAAVLAVPAVAQNATVQGYVLDPCWWADHPQSEHYGTGQYEYGVAGNITNGTSLGFFEDTDVYGYFGKTLQANGVYTLATWDTWWRSAFLFNRSITSGGWNPVFLRLHANMWSYAAGWGGAYNELGQMFAATGTSVVMIVVRTPWADIDFTVTIHEGGPDGPQVGPVRTFRSDSGPTDFRLIYAGGEVPTTPGNLYYIKFKAAGVTKGMICLNTPTPDMSDPMPEGHYYADKVPFIGQDLGLTICSDDDGVLTNLFARSGGQNLGGYQIGQTFTARGTSLLKFAVWIPDVSNTYVATLYNSVGGAKIGTAKKNRVMRSGDPQVMWTWAPGECPLTPGNTYYLEVNRENNSYFACYGNPYNPYTGGQAYSGRTPAAASLDLAGCIMEEESAGSATPVTVGISTFPEVAPTDRTPDSLTVRWTTDVASDSTVEYAAWNCPYTGSYYNSTLVTSHVATITDLQPNTMYHLRVKSAASGRKPAVTRDFVTATTNLYPNLLANPGFEDGVGASPRKPIPNWTFSGNTDHGASDGTWFWGLPAYSGGWFAQLAANASGGDASLYQTVTVTPGMRYGFTVAVSDYMRENNEFKYDVWHQTGRLPYIRIGLDPTGGHNPNSLDIQWSTNMYSHCHYTVIGTQATAVSDKMTVVIDAGQQGGQWLLFGFDDASLSSCANYVPWDPVELKTTAPDGTTAEVADLIVTAQPSEVNSYYVENADRTFGIKVVSPDIANIGDTVTVRGMLQTDPLTGERSLAGSLLDPQPSTEPEPLLMLCKSVGGEALGVIPAVPGSVGPHNTGLVIRVAGEVKFVEEGGAYIYINDGSLPGNGLRVNTSIFAFYDVPQVGQVLGISGISSLIDDGGVKPLLIARRITDIGPAQ